MNDSKKLILNLRDDIEDDCVALPKKEVTKWANKNIAPLFKETSKKPTSNILKKVRTKWDDITKKEHLGLMDYLKRVWEKPGDPEFNLLRPDYITTKEFDDFLEKVFEPPKCCAHGCAQEEFQMEEKDWLMFKCRNCGRTSFVHRETLKMWRVKDG